MASLINMQVDIFVIR